MGHVTRCDNCGRDIEGDVLRFQGEGNQYKFSFYWDACSVSCLRDMIHKINTESKFKANQGAYFEIRFSEQYVNRLAEAMRK